MTRTIAHRGFAGAAPENTVAAAEFAADRGADLVEVDVMPSADGEAVVFHDGRLDGEGTSRGITDGSGAVWEATAAELAGVTVLDSGERVPTLAAVRDALPPGVGLNVELKHHGAGGDPVTGTVLDADERRERAALWEPLVAEVLSVLDGFDGELLVTSFAEGALAALRAAAPGVALAPLVDERVDVALALADRYDAAAVHPSVRALGAPWTAGEEPDAGPVERAHDAGYAVNVWTVETWRHARALRAAGVDGVAADYPELTAWERT